MINSSAQVYHKVQIAADWDGRGRNESSNWYQKMKMCTVALQNKLVISSNLSLTYTPQILGIFIMIVLLSVSVT